MAIPVTLVNNESMQSVHCQSLKSIQDSGVPTAVAVHVGLVLGTGDGSTTIG